jgi:hypothetical protein
MKLTPNDLSKDLNEPLKIPKEIFVGQSMDEKVSEVLLSMAVFFNDLRDLELLNKIILQDEDKIPKKICKEFGQFNGIRLFIAKLYYAFIFEFIDLIKVNIGAISSDEFSKIISKLRKPVRNCWDEILFEINKPSKFIITLEKLRHNTAFHYYKPKLLMRGYKKFFLEWENTPYLSQGTGIADTRFYFADAAIQGARNIILENNISKEDWEGAVSNFIKKIWLVLLSIMLSFITSKCAPQKLSESEQVPSGPK